MTADLVAYAFQHLALVAAGAAVLGTGRWYQRRAHQSGRDRRHLFIGDRCECGAVRPSWSGPKFGGVGDASLSEARPLHPATYEED